MDSIIMHSSKQITGKLALKIFEGQNSDFGLLNSDPCYERNLGLSVSFDFLILVTKALLMYPSISSFKGPKLN